MVASSWIVAFSCSVTCTRIWLNTVYNPRHSNKDSYIYFIVITSTKEER